MRMTGHAFIRTLKILAVAIYSGIAFSSLAMASTTTVHEQKDLYPKKAESFHFYWDFEGSDPLNRYANNSQFGCSYTSQAALKTGNNADFTFTGQHTLNNGVLKTTSGYFLSSLWANNFSNCLTSFINDFSYSVDLRVRASGTSGKGVSIYETPASYGSIGGISILNNNGFQEVYYGILSAGNPDRLLAKKPDGDFFDIRILATRDANLIQYSIFLDGQRVTVNALQSRAYSMTLDRFIGGDIGSDHIGQLEIDHIAFDFSRLSTHDLTGPGQIYTPDDVVPITSIDPDEGNEMVVSAENNGQLTSRLVSRRASLSGCGIGGENGLQFVRSDDAGQSWLGVGCIFGQGSVAGITGFTNDMLIDAGPTGVTGHNTYVFIYRDVFRKNGLPSTDNAEILSHYNAAGDPIFDPTVSYDVYSIRSTDGGLTWTDQQLVMDGYNGDFKSVTLAANGNIVLPLSDVFVSSRDGNPATDKDHALTRIFYSENQGASWNEAINYLDVALAGVPVNGDEDGSIEPMVSTQANGTMRILMRTAHENALGETVFWQSESFNHGRQWKDFQASDIVTSSTSGSLITLMNGDLALISSGIKPQYLNDDAVCRRTARKNHAVPVSICRDEVFLRISSDNGASWSAPKLIASQAGRRLVGRMFEYSPGTIWMKFGTQWYEYNP